MAGGDAGLDLGASSQSSPTTAHEARCGGQPKSIGSFAEDLARARVSWLISPEARGTSHLNCRGGSEGGTQGRPKRFRTSERPRNSRERSWPKPNMSVRARSILICRNGRSPQRRCLNGSMNRTKTIWPEQAGSPRSRVQSDRKPPSLEKAKAEAERMKS
jgi:hypothetical protein